MKRAVVSWSGGKDAAWSLYRSRAEYEVVALVCTVAETTAMVPVHNISQRRIAAQASALGLPLWTVPLPQPCSNAEYRERMQPVFARARTETVDTIIFGDLFLADIRAWREQLLAPTGITPVFPLWLEPTRALASEMLAAGLDATVCAVDETKLSPALLGRSYDQAFLSALPEGVDPCGENGEFHTWVRNMPGFSQCAESYL